MATTTGQEAVAAVTDAGHPSLGVADDGVRSPSGTGAGAGRHLAEGRGRLSHSMTMRWRGLALRAVVVPETLDLYDFRTSWLNTSRSTSASRGR